MPASDVTITATDFVTIPTRDLDAAISFYTDVLGLECSKRYEGIDGAECETGNLTLQLFAVESVGVEFSPNKNPIALRVDDVHKARAALESRGISFKQDTLDSGVCHMAFFEDPEGNLLALHHRYAPK